MEAYLNGKRIQLNPSRSIGRGGEAEVFDIGNGLAAKIFKPPNHPDYVGLPQEQEGARRRLAEHQIKLPAFPPNLPGRVVTPQRLVTDKIGNRILGYTMRLVRNAEVLLRYRERHFREVGIPNQLVVEIFQDLHRTVSQLHQTKVVIGDFNDLNALVKENEVYFIDADSFQFGQFLCQLFTAGFVDPLLCDPHLNTLILQKPHNANSDWYAYLVMLMQSLLFVGPYGGVYRPKDPRRRLPQGSRPLQRITVFRPEVIYPRPAIHYQVLPDELLDLLQRVFEKDERGMVPLKLLENLRWTSCAGCGIEHARNICPECAEIAPPAIKEVIEIRGKVTSTRIFQTRGHILFAAHQNGKINFLYHENGEFKREDGSTVLSGKLDPQMRFRIQGEATLVGKDEQLVKLTRGQEPTRIAVDTFGLLPIFDANERNIYWTAGGRLLREANLDLRLGQEFASEYIGDVLSGQTLFWVGPAFGFGFYRAGDFKISFIFDVERRGINDTVEPPPLRGQLVDSTCVFTKERCWFLISSQEGGKTINRCLVIKKDGSVEARAEAEENDGSWLETLRGKCAVGNFLLVATDEGIVRVEPQNGQVVKTREFPDTAPFVDASCHLFLGGEGLYIVSRKEIRLLKIQTS